MTSESPGLTPGHIFYQKDVSLRELSIFVDESGGQGGQSERYLLTLVFHEQSDDISTVVSRYEESLRARGLDDIPFHAGPLLNGNDMYKLLSSGVRKQLLTSFNVFVQRLPVKYATFCYRRNEIASDEDLSSKMRRDISVFIFEHLG